MLSPTEAREFDAIAARILPTTDTPGAREAGVIYFMDKAFGTIMAGELPDARRGLADFQAGIAAAYPGAGLFSDLDEFDEDQYLQSREQTDFFLQMHFMTLCGFFAMSSYGGNRDNVGWKLIRFEGRHGAWQPPFGHYDAEYMRGQKDAE
ncbi:MAG: gluconate 2-dehydrogenase subunit 3 family protein [Woeseia sp.]